MLDMSKFNPEYLWMKVPEILEIARKANSAVTLKENLFQYALKKEHQTFDDNSDFTERSIMRVRYAARILCRILMNRSEKKSNFSVAEAIGDIAQKKPRPDLKPAFYAELLYLFLGFEGRGPGRKLADFPVIPAHYSARQAAEERSYQLDKLSMEVNSRTAKYVSGLKNELIEQRSKRRDKILRYFNASIDNWYDWRWQMKNIMRDPKIIFSLSALSEEEKECIKSARELKIPFAITPYYLSLMDDECDFGRDQSVRSQVIPPISYIETVSDYSRNDICIDFMLEADTSPIDLITRRYPAICILKPLNTCPQICVYCQRNWEIKDAMEPEAMASEKDINKAIEWIREHKAIHEVLITGGDPLAMSNEELDCIIKAVADIPTIERIRIGSRVPVTMPMRITDKLVDVLAKYRVQGKRQIALVTHIQHPYEITPDVSSAVDKLLLKGISVYNQMVYTFYNSRRFEAAYLRRILTRIGVDPYYTFCTKGKEETKGYRVPIARMLQEQNEEARLLPGLSRTDEAVFNIPGLGKNYLRRLQDRDLISFLPDGKRLYEFHPWEKNISNVFKTYLFEDIPILDYLQRLEAIGEDIHDYETIWYYH